LTSVAGRVEMSFAEVRKITVGKSGMWLCYAKFEMSLVYPNAAVK
jgi:hypothetical protein